MRVGVIGAGIAGLTAAHVLSRLPADKVVLYERASTAGGRARLTDSAEHCPRVFLDDYSKLFSILRQVSRPGGATLLDSVQPLDRFYYTSHSEWVKISRLFGFQAKELPLRDRLGIARIGWSSAVLAEYPTAVNTNRYSPGTNWSPSTLVRAAWKAVRSRGALALTGPTDSCLLDPWVADLADHGVAIRLGQEVSMLESRKPAGIRVHCDGTAEDFDAVIVAAFVPDVIKLLDASSVSHRLTALRHTHLKVITISLDSREDILRLARPALYHSGGLGLLVQPASARCVAVCIRGPSNDDEYVMGRVRRDIDLKFPFADVRVRDNLQPEEGLYTADYVNPARILDTKMPRIYFAGSYVKNRYPVDSAEGACLTGLSAVTALRCDRKHEQATAH